MISTDTAFVFQTAPQAPSRALPLTDSQREIWFASQMSDSASAAFNQSCVMELEGALDESALLRALHAVVQRHDALRTTFASDGEFQCVHATVPMAFRTDDLAALGPEEQWKRTKEILKATVQTPFDLINGPLFRYHLIKISRESHRLVLAVHHLICDGTSFTQVQQEVAALYSADVKAAPMPPEPRLQFSQFAVAHHEMHRSPKQAKVEEFWVKKFVTAAPFLELPSDRRRPGVRTFAGGSATRKLDAGVSREFKRVGTRQRCTPFTSAMAAFYALLYRLTGQKDIVIGVPVSARSGEAELEVIGHCINFLPLRLKVNGQQSFVEHLLNVRQMLLDVYDNQHYTFGRLIQKLNLPRQPGRAPLVPVMFNLDHIHEEPVLEGLKLEAKPNPHALTNFDWSLSIADTPSGMELQCLYSRDLFAPETIERWLGHFEAMMAEAAARPEEALDQIRLMSPTEQQQVIGVFSRRETPLLNRLIPDGIFATDGAGRRELYVLNAAGQSVPIGVVGELHVGGVMSTAVRPELAEKVVRHPYDSHPDARLYRTGSLARFLPTGDLEIESLPEQPTVDSESPTETRASAQLEYALITLWQEVLGVGEVSVNDDFFDLGGHSLLLARIRTRIENQYGVSLSLRAFFDAPTIAELARVIEGEIMEQIDQMPPEQVKATAAELQAGA